MFESESLAREPSKGRPARTCGNSTGELRNIFALVRTIVPKPRGKWLERVTDCSPRTAEYWLQGKHHPRGGETLAIVRALRVELERHTRLLQQFELDLR